MSPVDVRSLDGCLYQHGERPSTPPKKTNEWLVGWLVRLAATSTPPGGGYTIPHQAKWPNDLEKGNADRCWCPRVCSVAAVEIGRLEPPSRHHRHRASVAHSILAIANVWPAHRSEGTGTPERDGHSTNNNNPFVEILPPRSWMLLARSTTNGSVPSICWPFLTLRKRIPGRR